MRKWVIDGVGFGYLSGAVTRSDQQNEKYGVIVWILLQNLSKLFKIDFKYHYGSFKVLSMKVFINFIYTKFWFRTSTMEYARGHGFIVFGFI